MGTQLGNSDLSKHFSLQGGYSKRCVCLCEFVSMCVCSTYSVDVFLQRELISWLNFAKYNNIWHESNDDSHTCGDKTTIVL